MEDCVFIVLAHWATDSMYETTDVVSVNQTEAGAAGFARRYEKDYPSELRRVEVVRKPLLS